MMFKYFLFLLLFFASITLISKNSRNNSKYYTYTVDLVNDNLAFFHLNDTNSIIRNFKRLKANLDDKGYDLLFACNGGMYDKGFTPHGLYIENGVLHKELDTIQEEFGNFYIQPNGVFFITYDNKAYIKVSSEVNELALIKNATQSGPMLVINGELHTYFSKKAKSKNIRNGVGILPDGRVIFVMSKIRVNLYTFAKYFQDLGCQNALYLDGFVSKMFIPNILDDKKTMIENYGVLLGVIKKR